MKKVLNPKEAKYLEQIPNIGPEIAKDLCEIGIKYPKDLIGKDGIRLYHTLSKVSGIVHDPCVADVFMAAVDFMETGKVKKWWEFTSERKRVLKAGNKK